MTPVSLRQPAEEPETTKGAQVLSNGDSLPPIPAKDLDGQGVDLTELTTGSWSVVLLYRGHW